MVHHSQIELTDVSVDKKPESVSSVPTEKAAVPSSPVGITIQIDDISECIRLLPRGPVQLLHVGDVVAYRPPLML